MDLGPEPFEKTMWLFRTLWLPYISLTLLTSSLSFNMIYLSVFRLTREL